jgi:hypothetical protein
VPNVGNLARSYPVSLRISSAMVSPRKGRGRAAVERPAAQREEQALLRRCEGREGDAYVLSPSPVGMDARQPTGPGRNGLALSSDTPV